MRVRLSLSMFFSLTYDEQTGNGSFFKIQIQHFTGITAIRQGI